MNATGDAFALIVPFGDGWYRVIAWDRHDQPPEDAPVSLDEIADVARQALGADLRHARPALDVPASTATNARCPATGTAGCCWPATPPTSTPRPAARA